MAQTTNDIKNGSVLNLDGQLWTVIKFQHVKPGKGPAFVRTTIKNVLSGKIVDKTFNAGMKMEFELPASVVLTVTHTEPGLQGNRSNAGTKPATVETGAEIQVPLFIGEGEKVKVNTTDGSYLGREN